MKAFRQRSGFTVIELLMVIAILLVLAGIVMAAAGPARESARQNVCISNFHQWAAALSMYRADYDGMDAAQGVRMQLWQLGLPADKSLDAFARSYLPARGVRFCPDYHDDMPADVLWSTYWWVPDPFFSGGDPLDFSVIVAERGDQAPLLIDDNHNPWTTRTLNQWPRWTQERFIVLRLGGQVQNEHMPILTPFNHL